ncbi:MAG: HAMP domain-containing protein [Alphaproteobacteria bacterium]|jgi:two-component system nitrogen regulation sensor histidine kinase NtrY|nr:HAMP domain-containing protein [Alphaproteobacteria bacterium]
MAIHVRQSLPSSAQKAGWTLFQGLFFIATLLAAIATFFAVSGVSPLDPTQGRIAWLLGINFVLIALLGWMNVHRYLGMRSARHGASRNRLARRFLMLFSVSAIVPAAIVAIFLGAMITRGLDNWFNTRIDTIVEETAEVARDNYEDLSDALDKDIRLMAGDLDNAAEGLRSGSDLYPSYLKAQSTLREFVSARIIDAQGNVLARAGMEADYPFIKPPESAFAEADSGTVAQTLYEPMGLITGLAALSENDNAYLYVYKPFDPAQLAQMRRAEAALTDYRAAKTRSGRLQWLFAVAYAQLAALILLLSVRLGLVAANQITGPIGRLADAAMAVRDGDLSVRVPAPRVEDEVHHLTRSFNMMTEQLAQQRDALVSAREDAEDRRQFVETLLAEVSAGVIRTDSQLQVTLANRSACALLERDNPETAQLGDMAPEFEPFARDALERGTPIDASLDVQVGEATRYFRLKAARDPAGGCVLTFDDATRLVMAQRQIAWRDVARRIAHEIRNPLTPIQLSTERLRRRYGERLADDDGVFERCLDTILRQVTDIGRMVEEFSSFARMPKPSIADFDIVALLHDICFSQGVVTPDIDIQFETSAQTVRFSGDERLLSQALTNLLKNSAEAIERLPEESETAGRIHVELTNGPEDCVKITIEDNGPGFPAEARERLLEPYVTTREKGSGLGLAIVNRIIMDHGGSISLQNRSDNRRGARVHIQLPHIAHAADDNPVPLLEESVV